MKIHLRKFLLFLLVFEYFLPIKAQTIIQQFTTKEGLSHNFVYYVFKDSRGLIWASTQIGLCVFNGSKFENVDVTNNKFGSSVSKYNFLGICEDRFGQLYFATYGHGIFQYNITSKKFKQISTTNYPDLKSNQVLNVVSKNDLIFCSTNKGIVKYNIIADKIVSTIQNSPIHNEGGIDVAFCGDSTILIYEGHLQIHVNKNNAESIVNSSVPIPLIVDADTINGKIYCATKKGIYFNDNLQFRKFNITAGQADLSNEYFLAVGNLNERKYILSSILGLHWIDSVRNEHLFCHKEIIQPENEVALFTAVTPDPQNNSLLIASNGGGVIIETFQKTPFKYHKLPKDIMASVCSFFNVDSNTLILGTEKDMVIHKIINTQFNEIKIPTGNSFINNFHRYSAGILALTASGIFNYSNGTINKKIPKELIPFENYSCYGIRSNNNSKSILFSFSENYFIIWNELEKTVDTLKNKSNSFQVNTLVWLDDYHFLFSSNNLYIVDIRNKSFKAIDTVFNDQFITDFETFNHKIYISTASSGLYQINKTTLSIEKHFTDKSGLLSNFIYNLQSGQQYLWMSTSNGINRLDTNNNFNYYLAGEGFKHSEFDLIGSHSSGNIVYFGQKDGYTSIDENIASAFQEKNSVIPLEISFYENGEYKTKIPEDNQYSFSYNQNSIKIQLASTDYLVVDRNEIFYRLNQDEWESLGKDKSLNLIKLAEGNYNLQFCNNPSLNKNGQITSIQLKILPPWWKTWWFRSFIALLSSIFLWLAFRYYYNNKLKQQQLIIDKLTAVNNERERISGDIHDDMGSNVSSLLLLSKMIKNEQLNDENLKNLHEIQIQTTELSQKMRDIVWATKTENDTLEHLIQYIRQYAIRQLEPLGFGVKITYPDSIQEITIQGEKRKDIFLTFKECINNIIKHSVAKKVKVMIEFENLSLLIKIIDDGIGMPINIQYGNGIKLMQKRMGRHGGVVEINNENKIGVEVSINCQLNSQ